MKQFPTSITVLLEPTAACNLRCKHCYHAKSNYDEHIMSIDTLEKFLSISAPFYKVVRIIWHGGEPLLAGVNFFKVAFNLFAQYSKAYGTYFKIGIQTNATLLNQEYLNLFCQNHVHISVSYDGSYNNILRHQTMEVEKNIELLKKNNIRFTCLTTLTNKNIDQLIELYEEFKAQSINYKFNPILPDGKAVNSGFLLSKEEWAEEFIRFFRYWYKDVNCNIRVSNCCEILENYLGRIRSGCVNGVCMFRFLAMDSYGNLFPCGRLMELDNRLVNVFQISDIREAYTCHKYKEILNKNIIRIKNCKNCKWFSKCHSGCNASSYINYDYKTTNEFHCFFIKKVYSEIQKLLKNYEDKKVNRYVKEIIRSKSQLK